MSLAWDGDCGIKKRMVVPERIALKVADTSYLEDLLADVYGHELEKIRKIIQRYKQLYDLPIIGRSEEVGASLFRHVGLERFFAVLAVCNEKEELFVLKDETASGGITWRLPSDYVTAGERLEDACERIMNQQVGLSIDQATPVAVVVNELVSGNRSIKHQGIAFLVETRSEESLGVLPKGSSFAMQMPEHMSYCDGKVRKVARQAIEERSTFPPLHEVDSARKRSIRYFLHSHFIKPPFEPLSSNRIKDAIKELCHGAKTVLDVACGDDTLVVELAAECDFCVANDMSWEMLKLIRQRSGVSNVIFSNHNALTLPFKAKFDVVICKNTVHHMRNVREFLALAESLRRVTGRRLLIVDIENPSKSTRWARAWYAYYVHFLGDQGHLFLTKEQFEGAIERLYQEAVIEFRYLDTVKGTYMFAIIDFL